MRIANLIAALLITICSCQQSIELEKGSHFTRLDPSGIGIDFVNTLSYDEDFNVYLFRSFYNGAGVGLGDLNNDGLLDVFFCGNQVDNRLYINKGDPDGSGQAFQFQDITQTAGLASPGAWSTGVSFVDINGDGWLDIYVCKSGMPEGENRHNELFINNGPSSTLGPGTTGVTFTESAQAYGIADLGFSVHAVFFDFDKDGDLDMYLSNNSINPTDVVMDASKGLRDKRDPIGGDKLYRNDGIPSSQGGTGIGFTDVSEAAGIYGSAIGFGLGISVGDVNRDGWPDIFVANDYFEKDYLYINQGDGAFKESLEEVIDETSLGSMGVDIADVNNDGYPEIFVTEMLPDEESRLKTKTVFDSWDAYTLKIRNGYYRQFPRNVFQLNNGPAGERIHFSEISRFSGVEATDWSWGVFMADLDNDGFKEIFITNGIVKDLLDRDYTDFYFVPEKMRAIYREKGVVIKELIDNMPSVPIPNYLFTHRGDMQFSNVSQVWGLGEPGFSGGAAYGDMDNDGDLDLVVSNINMPPFIYRNESQARTDHHFVNITLIGPKGNTAAIGSQVTLKSGGQLFFQELYPMRGSMSSVDPRLHFGLGDMSMIDTLEIIWTDGSTTTKLHIPANQFLTYNYEESNNKKQETKDPPLHRALLEEITNQLGIDYRHRENEFVDFDRDKLLYHMVSSEGPKLAIGDVNNDGLPDLYLGGAKDMSGSIYIMGPSGIFVKANNQLFEKDKVSEDTDALFFDADNDGDQDLLVASGGYEFPGSSFALADRLYINDGKGNFTASSPIIPNQKLVPTSCLAITDYDRDGDQDLFIGVRFKPFSYGVPSSSYLMENDGKGNFKDVSINKAPALQDIGMVTDALWFDADRDGDEDLVLVGDWMSLKIFINNNGVFEDATNEWGLSGTNGYWNVVEKADLDQDGDWDLIAGNLGLNTRFKASSDKPVSMYINDFDLNGKLDHIITVYNGDKAYPVAMKKDITKQIPSLLKKYLKHEEYKMQTVEDVFTLEQLSGALKLAVFETATMVFWNENGHFEGQALPMDAQLAPVYGILVDDIDLDGLPEILLGGNLYRAKPQVGIYGGIHGVVLKSAGQRKFRAMSTEQSGFFVRGEIRDIGKINLKGKNILLVARNNDPMKVFTYGKTTGDCD